jgi:hypothetical protein
MPDPQGKKLHSIPESLEAIGIRGSLQLVDMKTSPIIHTDKNDRLTKVNRTSDNIATIITAKVDFRGHVN